MCVCVCIHVSLCISVSAYVSFCVYVCLFVPVSVCVYLCVSVCVCVCDWWKGRGMAALCCAQAHGHEAVQVQRGSLPDTDAPQVPRPRQGLTPAWLGWTGRGGGRNSPSAPALDDVKHSLDMGPRRPLRWAGLPEQLPKECACEQGARPPG